MNKNKSALYNFVPLLLQYVIKIIQLYNFVPLYLIVLRKILSKLIVCHVTQTDLQDVFLYMGRRIVYIFFGKVLDAFLKPKRGQATMRINLQTYTITLFNADTGDVERKPKLLHVSYLTILYQAKTVLYQNKHITWNLILIIVLLFSVKLCQIQSYPNMHCLRMKLNINIKTEIPRGRPRRNLGHKKKV